MKNSVILGESSDGIKSEMIYMSHVTEESAQNLNIICKLLTLYIIN